MYEHATSFGCLHFLQTSLEDRLPLKVQFSTRHHLRWARADIIARYSSVSYLKERDTEESDVDVGTNHAHTREPCLTYARVSTKYLGSSDTMDDGRNFGSSRILIKQLPLKTNALVANDIHAYSAPAPGSQSTRLLLRSLDSY